MEELPLFIGTLNCATPYFQGACGDGMNVSGFDEDTLDFCKLAGYPQVKNPADLSVRSDGHRVYTKSELASVAHDDKGTDLAHQVRAYGPSVSVLARDQATGASRVTGAALQIGTPMCLKFAGV